jgi:acetyl-CoA carboxylase biotin carboxyl carrier protein
VSTGRGRTATVVVDPQGCFVLGAPAPGLWRDRPRAGAFLTPGDPLGQLEVLGACEPLVVPAPARGVVHIVDDDRARVPVGFGTVLVVLDPTALAHAGASTGPGDAAATVSEAQWMLRSPSSGRFYARPGPGKPPFVTAGEVIVVGRTVALLEVMKSFHRVQYEGAGLPDRARVVRVVPTEEADLAAGDPILELEPAP